MRSAYRTTLEPSLPVAYLRIEPDLRFVRDNLLYLRANCAIGSFAPAIVPRLRLVLGRHAVDEVYSAGFLRDGGPTSARDTHPQGRAWDIKGFRTHGTVIHLRRGFLVEPDEPNFANDHSDWFDNFGQVAGAGVTHEEQMRDRSWRRAHGSVRLRQQSMSVRLHVTHHV